MTKTKLHVFIQSKTKRSHRKKNKKQNKRHTIWTVYFTVCLIATCVYDERILWTNQWANVISKWNNRESIALIEKWITLDAYEKFVQKMCWCFQNLYERIHSYFDVFKSVVVWESALQFTDANSRQNRNVRNHFSLHAKNNIYWAIRFYFD